MAYLRNDLNFNDEDLLVVLGDFIDRGPDSAGCISLLKSMDKTSDNIMVIRGNHEGFLINCCVKNIGHYDWARNGGLKTLESYEKMHMTSVPHSHVEWIAKLPLYIEHQGLFFSHAPVPKEHERSWPKMPYTEDELTWTYYEEYLFTEPGIGGLDDHEGPLSNHGMGDTNLIGIHGHIHHGPSTEIRSFPMCRFLDCGAGSYDESPLLIHECLSAQSWYVFTDRVSENRFSSDVL